MLNFSLMRYCIASSLTLSHELTHFTRPFDPLQLEELTILSYPLTEILLVASRRNPKFIFNVGEQ